VFRDGVLIVWNPVVEVIAVTLQDDTPCLCLTLSFLHLSLAFYVHLYCLLKSFIKSHTCNDSCPISSQFKVLKYVRLIFGIRCLGQITDVFASLHWLRVPESILFKVAVFTYSALNSSAPAYLSSYFTRVINVSSGPSLRSWSSNSEQLIVPSFNLTMVSRRTFPVSAAHLWNSTCTPHLSTVAHDFPTAS